MCAQKRIYSNGDQCRHPQPMSKPCISEWKTSRAGERALARLPQTRRHTDVTGKRGSIAKAAWVSQLRD
jgi:hypothetical protein